MKLEVCHGKVCGSTGKYILLRLQRDLAHIQNQDLPIEISTCLCRGRCVEGPNIVIDGEIFTKMDPIKATQTLQRKRDILFLQFSKGNKNNAGK